MAPTSDCGLAPLACGCDGVVAHSCGDAVGSPAVDVANPARCPTPAGTFVCGSQYCEPSESQYCQGNLDLTTCAEDNTCVSIPSACTAAPTCDCIANADDLVTCSGDAQSGFAGELPADASPSCP